ncbi:thiol reductant ABC exporter subunit CydC [Staphylococcus simulans]|uniref:thiol reductant ABC exporter subunit CydC n=1 Tax=Staphylococcus simulans TaxID=1286 RepID=UPI00399AA037
MKRHGINFKLDKDLALAILFGVIGSLVAIGMFFLSGLMIAQAAKNVPLYGLIVLVVSVKMFGIIRAIMRYFERLYSHRTTFTMLRDVRTQFFDGLIQVVPDIYRKFKSSDLISRMVSRVEALQNIYLRVYYPPVVIGLTSAITILTLWFFSWMHAILLLVSMLISLGILPWVSAKRAQLLNARAAKDASSFLSRFYDFKEGYEELVRFKRLKSYRQSVLKALAKYSHQQRNEQRFLTLYEFMLDLVSMSALFFCVWLGVIQVQNGQLDVIYLTSIVLMLLTLFEQAVSMSNVAYFKADTDQALIELEEVLQEVPAQSETKVSMNDAQTLHAGDITFKYEHQVTKVLDAIQLEVQAGEKLAIIGPSGSGKSTLLQVLAGLYQTKQGAVTYQGQSVYALSEADKAATFNVLLQQQQLFDGTVRDNLLSDRKDDEMRAVLDDLGLAYIDLDYEITMSGEGLSGGELQRLCLARLFLRTAPVWLIDEPTRALDWDNSVHVMQHLFNESETLIVATHDLALLPQFDRIVVMIEGRIIESGTYESLLQQQGALYDMVALNQES